MGKLISDKFAAWQEECEQRFQQLKANEEELNRIFIDIYGLQDELTPEVEDKDVTVRRADLTREIKSLLSYAVGCLFGRYSLDVDGLVYAGGEWDDSKYVTLKPVTDNVLPLCDEEYFGENDLVNRIVEFVRVVYGADTLEENLAFVAKALGNKGHTSREIIRNYFLKDFFADHCKIYQKRPIYWMFDSGKKNGFKALVYLHRWDADTTGRVYTITPKTGITFQGGYDIKANKLTTSSISISRDLHCWQMSFSWIPFGFHRSWSFNIGVKAASLSDLKYDKSQSMYDNMY